MDLATLKERITRAGQEKRDAELNGDTATAEARQNEIDRLLDRMNASADR